MVKAVKVGGVVAGVAVLAGVGIGGWMYTHRNDDAAVETTSSQRTTSDNEVGPIVATVPADSAAAAAASPATGGQTVVNNGAQGAIANSQAGSASASSSSSGRASLPGPSDFKQYDQYKNNASALYIDVKAGTGAAVAQGSKVTVNYRGWLTDGREFDESYNKGQPFSFTEGAGGVIPGWEQGMFGMKVGGQRRLVVPPGVGYGAAGMDPIPSNSVLVFDVELVGVQ